MVRVIELKNLPSYQRILKRESLLDKQEGISQGIRQKMIKTIKNTLTIRFDIQTISKLAHFLIDEINKIKKRDMKK